MPQPFASGKHSIAECDRCGFRFKLRQLKQLTIKFTQVNIMVCRECWEASHPQLLLGTFPVSDPQAVRNPRPDRSYVASGLNVLGNPGDGSRITQWGWAPVGGARNDDDGLTPNYLVSRAELGTVTVS
jgi:hypothetical protein